MRYHSIYDYLPEINADTAEEMAEQAGMDFTAIKTDIKYTLTEKPVMLESIGNLNLIPGIEVPGKEKDVVIPDKVAVIREDDGRYLGTVGRNRGILQYRDILAFTEALIDDGSAAYVKGGVIGNGEQAYLVMKTNKTIKLSETDDIDCYFYVTASHNSTKGLSLVLAPLRNINGTVIATNYSIGFRHTSRVEQRVKQAALSIQKLNDYFTSMEESFRLLRSVTLTADQRDVFFKSLFPDSEDRPKRAENIRTEITDIFLKAPACQLPSTKGTMLGAYLAVVEWVDKFRNVKASKVRPNEYDAKLHSILEGSGAQQKAEAYAFALDMVKKLGNINIFGNGE